MKICVFGSSGLLGEALVRHFSSNGHTVIAMTRSDCDLSEGDSIQSVLENLQPDIVFNASGLTGLEACLDNPQEANKVNVHAPESMAAYCATKHTPFIHFSTDYVFNGYEQKLVTETCKSDPINTYGKSKLDGENAVLRVYPDALVCRVSWLFGRGRKGFVDQVVENALMGRPQAYIADKYSVPNYTDDLAHMVSRLVDKRAHGLIHLCSDGGEVTWFSYAQHIVGILYELGHISSVQGLLTESKLDEITAFRASRPRYTSMKSVRMLEEYGVTPTDWKQGLKRHLLSVL